MSTHAGIGIKEANGTIKASYLHRDGYPAYAGAILGGFYKTREQVENLITLGNLSVIGKNIEQETIAYHRDRNEKLQSAIEFKNESDYIRRGENHFGADFLYLFNPENNEWTFFKRGYSKKFIGLEVTIGE